MNKLWSDQKWSTTTRIVKLCVRNSYAKRNLLLLRLGSRETKRLFGALGSTKSAIKDGVSILSVQIEK